MKIILQLTLLGIFYLFSAHVSAAGDASTGKDKATVCAGCHGFDGHSSNDLWPNLAGQKAGYLILQIKAFRDQQRISPMMQPMVASLTDQDIEDLAAFYAGLKK